MVYCPMGFSALRQLLVCLAHIARSGKYPRKQHDGFTTEEHIMILVKQTVCILYADWIHFGNLHLGHKLRPEIKSVFRSENVIYYCDTKWNNQ